MNHRVRVAFAAALIIVFGIFLPSTLLFHDVNTFVKEAKSHTQAEAKYTNEIGDQILQGSYLRSEGRKDFFLTRGLSSVEVSISCRSDF